MTIVRGTVPAVLFGPRNYGALLGRLALPAFVAKAVAPVAFTSVLAIALARQAPLWGLALGRPSRLSPTGWPRAIVGVKSNAKSLIKLKIVSANGPQTCRCPDLPRHRGGPQVAILNANHYHYD